MFQDFIRGQPRVIDPNRYSIMQFLLEGISLHLSDLRVNKHSEMGSDLEVLPSLIGREFGT